jgi:hypothetical protein
MARPSTLELFVNGPILEKSRQSKFRKITAITHGEISPLALYSMNGPRHSWMLNNINNKTTFRSVSNSVLFLCFRQWITHCSAGHQFDINPISFSMAASLGCTIVFSCHYVIVLFVTMTFTYQEMVSTALHWNLESSIATLAQGGGCREEHLIWFIGRCCTWGASRRLCYQDPKHTNPRNFLRWWANRLMDFLAIWQWPKKWPQIQTLVRDDFQMLRFRGVRTATRPI